MKLINTIIINLTKYLNTLNINNNKKYHQLKLNHYCLVINLFG